MGRQSAAARLIAAPVLDRPYPPEDLTEEEAKEWWAIVNRLPPDWFPMETQPILAQYCRHIIMARRVAGMIWETELGFKKTTTPQEKMKALNRFYQWQEKQSRSLMALGTRLRITQQSLYDQTKKRGKVTSHAKPWDDDK
jgi:hypothetical protein